MSERSIGSVVVAIQAVDQASGIIGKVQGAVGSLTGFMSRMGGVMGDAGNIINSAFSGFVTGGAAGAALGAGTAALGAIVEGLQACVKEATASEAVWSSLGAAVSRSGLAWDSVKKATEGALLAMSKTTTYSDEQLAQALEKLMTFGISYDDAMKALGKTIDFAAAKHMDLESAATLVGKAMDGNTAIMKRYGVDIATTKERAAALAAAQDAAAKAIKAMGDGVATWVTNVTAAIGADSQFEQGLATAKDKAAFLIDQFKAGNIDVAQFATAMTSLGVPLDDVALKGGSAEAVLAKLNEQFGGAAGEAAKTYAGTQERLKNATQDVGEKIGMIVLPALASLTEAMIPVVDWLGKGVDAIQAWMTEVGKMPEVKAATEAVGAAWQGLMVWFDSAAKSAQEVLGPALKDLWAALTDLYDALGPIFDALKELWDAITGSQGDFDAFRAILEVIKLDIEASIEAIKLVTGAVRLFAQEFKAAADFIAPVLAQMVSAVTGFLKTMHDSIQAFYMWFVGGSLWQTLWQAVIDIATKAIATLIGIFTTNLVTPITGILTALGATIQTGWAAAWSGLSEAFLGFTSSVQSAVASVWDPLSAYLQTAFGNWGTWANNAMTSIGVAITTGMEKLSQALTNFMGVVEKGWTDFGAAFNTLMTGIATTVIGVVTAASGKLNEILGGMISAAQAAQSTIAGILASISSSIQSMLAQAAAAAGTAGNWITDAFTGAWNTVADTATDFYNWLVGGSLWPDLMDMLVSQTQAGMSEVKASFEKGLGGVVLNAPTIPELTAAMNLTALGAAGASSTQTTPTPAPSQTTNVTLPVTVQVDGATISRVVERRLIANRQLSAWRSA